MKRQPVYSEEGEIEEKKRKNIKPGRTRGAHIVIDIDRRFGHSESESWPEVATARYYVTTERALLGKEA